MKSILDRLKEPSSYAGIAVLIAVFMPGTEEQWVEILTTGAAFAAALAAVFMSEWRD